MDIIVPYKIKYTNRKKKMKNPYDTQVGGSHYKDMAIQPSEFINKNKILFAEGNAIKYICRHSSKGEKQDLEKAKHYIDMIIERDYAKQNYNSIIRTTCKLQQHEQETRNTPYQ